MIGRVELPAGARMERTRARRESPLEALGGLLALAAAVALWVVVLAGVVAPLGEALVHLDASPRQEDAASCPVPPDVIASAPRAPRSVACR